MDSLFAPGIIEDWLDLDRVFWLFAACVIECLSNEHCLVLLDRANPDDSGLVVLYFYNVAVLNMVIIKQ